MDYSAKFSKQPIVADYHVIGLFENGELPQADTLFDEKIIKTLKTLLQEAPFPAKPGEYRILTPTLPNLAGHFIVAGCGDAKKLNEQSYQTILVTVGKALRTLKAKTVHFTLNNLAIPNRDTDWKVRRATELLEAAFYQFIELKTKTKPPIVQKPKSLVYRCLSKADEKPAEKAIAQGKGIAEGVKLARDLGNRPANVCTPSHLAQNAKDLAKRFSSITVKVLEKAQIEKLGMGSFLSVTHGSHEPPKLIVLEYRGTKSKMAPIALVGKGITFDSGGISLKGGTFMDEMKFDMSGAGSVLGAFLATAALKLPIHLVGVIAATENLPGGSATKPGDIVKSLSGQTIEILNTDAEGRLVLCDALTYVGRYKPKTVIDIATLTGACVAALGAHPSGLFSNDESLAQELLTAGDTAQDRAWRMPLWEVYQEQIDSPFADIANIGPPGEGGAITAACFLWRFTEDYRWAHLDVAGTAYKRGKEKGSTGRPVPLLMQYLIQQSET